LAEPQGLNLLLEILLTYQLLMVARAQVTSRPPSCSTALVLLRGHVCALVLCMGKAFTSAKQREKSCNNGRPAGAALREF